MRVFVKKHKETQQPKSSIPNRTNTLISHDVNLAPVQSESTSPVTGNSWDFSRIPVIAPESRDGAPGLAHVVQQRSSPPTIQRQPAPHDPFAPGEIYDQLETLRNSGTLSDFEYRDKDLRELSFDDWKVEIQIRRARKFSAALKKIGELKDQRAVSLLIDIVEDKIIGPNDFTDKQVLSLKEETLATLARIGGSVALWKLHELLNSKDPNERTMGARALSAASGRVAVADLHLALAQETDVTVKSQIIRSLGQVSGLDAKTTQTIFTELIDIIEKSPIDLRRAAVTALASMQLKTATEPLIKQLKDHHGIKEYAAAIVEALGNIGDDRALEILVIMLENHGSPLVRGEAATALGKIGGKGIAALKGRLKQEKDAVVIFAIKRALMQNLHWEFKSAEATP